MLSSFPSFPSCLSSPPHCFYVFYTPSSLTFLQSWSNVGSSLWTPRLLRPPPHSLTPNPWGFPRGPAVCKGQMSGWPQACWGDGELGRAGPGGGGAAGRGPRLLGDLGAITVSLPPPPFSCTPVGAVKMQDTRPASFSPDGGRRGGSPRIPGLCHPPAGLLGAGSPGTDTAPAWVTLWPGPRAPSAAGAVWVLAGVGGIL